MTNKPKTHSRDWFIERQREASEAMDKLRELFPGCFDENGRAIVASAHFPRLPAAPKEPT